MKTLKLILVGLLIHLGPISSAQLTKFYIGMYTMDFDNPTFYNCGKPEPYNTDKAGHDSLYLAALKKDHFNLIISWIQYLKPSVQYVNIKENSPSKAYLDRAEAAGIAVVVTAPELYYDINWAPSPEWKAPAYFGMEKYDPLKSKNAINYFKDHKAVAGWMLTDEPGTEQFKMLALLTRDIKKYSNKFPHINLLPIGATSGQYLKGKSSENGSITSPKDYDNYIKSYIKTVKPAFITVDCFNPTVLFANLEIIRKNALKNKIPFTWVVTVGGSGEPYKTPGYCAQYQNTTYGECAFKIFSALTYGAKGINYFAREGLLGNETAFRSRVMMQSLYDGISEHFRNYMGNIHKSLIEKSSVLMSLTVNDVYHYSFKSTYYPGKWDSIPQNQAWGFVKTNKTVKNHFTDPNNLFDQTDSTALSSLAVSFGKDPDKNDYMWIFNKHLSDTLVVTPRIKTSSSLFNVLTDSVSISETILPGEGKLLLFR